MSSIKPLFMLLALATVFSVYKYSRRQKEPVIVQSDVPETKVADQKISDGTIEGEAQIQQEQPKETIQEPQIIPTGTPDLDQGEEYVEQDYIVKKIPLVGPVINEAIKTITPTKSIDVTKDPMEIAPKEIAETKEITNDSGTPEESYKFFLHKNSSEGDIEKIKFDNVSQMKASCSSKEGCKAFNSRGWLKHTVKPMNDWQVYFDNDQPTAGMWIKDKIAQGLESDFGGYHYVGGKDSEGNNLKHITFTNTSDMKQKCDELGQDCKAFNKAGWFKKTLKPFSQWTSSASSGTWIKSKLM